MELSFDSGPIVQHAAFVVALGVLTLLFLGAAWLVLVRGDPEQVLRKRAGR